MFKRKLNSENLANHVVQTLTQGLGFNLKHWWIAQQNRASTNKAVLEKIEYNSAQAAPSRNYCSAHTLINDGKQIIGPEGVTPHAEEFRKQW